MNRKIYTIQLKIILFLAYLMLIFTLRAQNTARNSPHDTLILESKKYRFHNCEGPQAPVFNLPANSILELELKTDFHALLETNKSEQNRIEGILGYTLNGKLTELPVSIKTRGRTRFEYCKYKPLDIKFSSSVDSTIFEGLEKKILIATHCGEMPKSQWILEGTPSEHRNRLLAEYYINSVLEIFETTTSLVSLCKIKYINTEDSVLTHEFAFLVEHYDDVASRCGLDRNKSKVMFLDKSSVINANLINHFVTNYDWDYKFSENMGWTGNNIKYLKSEEGLGYILPYDFDLNAIVFPDYWKNKSESFDEHCHRFQEMLTRDFLDKKKLEAPYVIYSNIPAIREMINESFMATRYKEKFTYWLNSYEFILANHLSQYHKYKKLIL